MKKIILLFALAGSIFACSKKEEGAAASTGAKGHNGITIDSSANTDLVRKAIAAIELGGTATYRAAYTADAIFHDNLDSMGIDGNMAMFKLPDFINKMMENKWLGSKTGQGFYKKEGKEILSLDLNTLEYRAAKKASFATLELTKTIDKPIDRFKVLVKGKDKAGDFYRKNFHSALNSCRCCNRCSCRATKICIIKIC